MEATEKEYSRFQWFLFVVFIPSFFTLIIVLVLLSVAGFKPIAAVKDFAAKTPIVSSLFNDEKEEIQNTGKDEVSITDLEAEIQVREKEIKQLESELEIRNGEVQSLQNEIATLSDELKQLQEERLAKSKTLQELTKVYELMSPKNAAKIIPNLEEDEAREILSSIETEKLAAIFEKMTPEDAARFTQLITR